MCPRALLRPLSLCLFLSVLPLSGWMQDVHQCFHGDAVCLDIYSLWEEKKSSPNEYGFWVPDCWFDETLHPTLPRWKAGDEEHTSLFSRLELWCYLHPRSSIGDLELKVEDDLIQILLYSVIEEMQGRYAGDVVSSELDNALEAMLQREDFTTSSGVRGRLLFWDWPGAYSSSYHATVLLAAPSGGVVEFRLGFETFHQEDPRLFSSDYLHWRIFTQPAERAAVQEYCRRILAGLQVK